MTSAAIAYSAQRWSLVLGVVGAATIGALAVLPRLSLDALPDLSDTQVIVTAEWPGHAADLMDPQVTAPIALGLRAVPGVRYVRGVSMTDDAFLYVVFEDAVQRAAARSLVAERLAGLRDQVPDGVVLRLGPDASSVGWIYEYALVDSTERLGLSELRALQDGVIRRRLQAISGVAEVASIGGQVARYEVELEPGRLAAYRLPLAAVAEAVRGSNRDVGSGVLEVGGQELVVTGRSQVRSPEDLATLPVSAGSAGAIVRLGDVGRVGIGAEPRRGLAELDGRGEVVGGIVVMRQRENAMRVLERVRREVAEVQRILPQGVRLVPTYDRTELVQRCLSTLRRALTIEAIGVSFVILLFLGSARSALIPIALLPIANLLAFVPLALGRAAVNIMSLGGIAIAAGVMVDGAIILVENVHKSLEQPVGASDDGQRSRTIVAAMSTVGRPVFFSLLVITVSFLPLLALQGAEGRMFRPLVLAKTFAMICAAVLTITLTPALATRLVPTRVRPEFGPRFARQLADRYATAIRWSLAHPIPMIVGAVLVLASTFPVLRSLGHEFMPELDEGALLYMPSGPAGLGAQLAAETLHRQDSLLVGAREVRSAFGKAGRAATATDPAPLSMFETLISLRPGHEFEAGPDRHQTLEKLDRLVRTPGLSGVWWMPIQTRNEMLATGIRSAIGLKVFGPEPAGIESLSVAIAALLRGSHGVRNAYAERLGRSAAVDLELLRDRVALAGLTPEEVEDAARAAIGGTEVGQVFLGRARANVSLRLRRPPNSGVSELLRTPLSTPSGVTIELGELVEPRWRDAPAMLQEEDGELFGIVTLDVSGRPVDVAPEAQRLLAERITIPAGYRIEWAGQYREYARARSRMLQLIPIALGSVVLLLLWSLRSGVNALIVLLAVPFSLAGAVWLLGLLHFQWSIAVWVGVLALAGLDAETGTIMLLFIQMAVDARRADGRLRSRADWTDAIVQGASRRVRPKLMTVSAILFGLVPILFERGPGSEVLRRVAAPMVGGVVSSFAMELFLYPCLYAMLHATRVRFRGSSA